MKKIYLEIFENRKFREREKSNFFRPLFGRKSWLQKKWFFLRNFRNFQFSCFSKIQFSLKNENFWFFLIFVFLSYIIPKPYKWRRATPPVPPVGASKIRKITFFDAFLWFSMIFQPKMTQMTCLSGLIWLWDPVLRRGQLQMDLARSSSGVMRTSAAR